MFTWYFRFLKRKVARILLRKFRILFPAYGAGLDVMFVQLFPELETKKRNSFLRRMPQFSNIPAKLDTATTSKVNK